MKKENLIIIFLLIATFTLGWFSHRVIKRIQVISIVQEVEDCKAKGGEFYAYYQGNNGSAECLINSSFKY